MELSRCGPLSDYSRPGFFLESSVQPTYVERRKLGTIGVEGLVVEFRELLYSARSVLDAEGGFERDVNVRAIAWKSESSESVSDMFRKMGRLRAESACPADSPAMVAILI